jgi:hypothetical protein
MTRSIPVNAEEKWDEIDIVIDLDEINEILEEKISSGKKRFKDGEARYAELMNAYREHKKEEKDRKREEKELKKAKKKEKGNKLSKDEKYIVYGAAAALAAYAAYHIFHKK